MKCALHQRMILLTCALLVAGQAGAAGRGSGSKATSSATVASDDWRQEQAGWLARLQGAFAVKLDIEEKIGSCRPNGPGQQKCELRQAAAYVSAANCSRIGAGPGLHCAFDELRPEVTGNDAGGVGAPARLSYNGLPTRMLFGIDPVARKLRVLLMDGMAGYDATGSLTGDDVIFKGRCDTPDFRNPKNTRACTWSLSIHAPPDGQKILMTRVRQNVSGSTSNSLFLSDQYEPHTFELNRVAQPAQSP